jgi:hypothetical protein
MIHPRSGPNSLPPETMPANARLTEVAQIFAAGLTRMTGATSTTLSAICGESSLDFAPVESGHEVSNQSREGGAK